MQKYMSLIMTKNRGSTCGSHKAEPRGTWIWKNSFHTPILYWMILLNIFWFCHNPDVFLFITSVPVYVTQFSSSVCVPAFGHSEAQSQWVCSDQH